jgi:hypothetical protein
MKYLVKTVEQYRVASEQEAKELIESSKKDGHYTLSKYSSEYKCTKAKGEVVDEWFRVILTKEFTSEKEPIECTHVSYYTTDVPNKAMDKISEDEGDNF